MDCFRYIIVNNTQKDDKYGNNNNKHALFYNVRSQEKTPSRYSRTDANIL